MARAAPVSQPGRRLRVLGVLAGITGPVLLAAYFAVPALVRWPQPGASARKLIAYATAHRLLFYGGGWLQATGALLSIVFFLVLLQLSGARGTLARHRDVDRGSRLDRGRRRRPGPDHGAYPGLAPRQSGCRFSRACPLGSGACE